MVVFQCVSGYSRKENPFFTKIHKTDTRKNSREQKKTSHRLLRIGVSVYQATKNTALGPISPRTNWSYLSRQNKNANKTALLTTDRLRTNRS